MSCDKTVKEIKALVVVFKDTLTKVGESIIPAPIGLNIDPKTGNLDVPVTIKSLGDIVLQPKIEKSKLINKGAIKLELTFEGLCQKPCSGVNKGICIEVFVPIESVHTIEQLCPDPHIQEKVKVKDISVKGVSDNSNPKSVGRKLNLVVKVTLEVELTIAREEIVLIPVADK